MIIPQITADETRRFSSVWTLNGVAVPFDEVGITFATDFANVCIRSLFAQLQPQMAAMAQRVQELEQGQEQQEVAKPQIILTGE